MSAEIHNFENHKSGNKYTRLVTAIQEVVQSNLTDVCQIIFDEADDLLFKTAEKNSNSKQQNLLFDDMRTLRVDRAEITKTFIRRVTRLLTSPAQKQGEVSMADELSLVSQDEMEELVAIGSIVNRAESTHAEAISHLSARIEHLALKVKLNFNKDALLPRSLCESFITAFDSQKLSDNTRLIFLKVFGKFIVEALGDIYETVNYRFIEAGILPQIKVNKPKPETNTESGNPLYHVASAQDSQITFPTVQGLPSGQEIQSILHNYMQRSLTSVTRVNNQNFYDRAQVVDSLSRLQISFPIQTNTLIDFHELRAALLSNINNGRGSLINKQVNHVDEKTIEIIEMLFKQILNDGAITPAVRTLILRLQIPVVKVAMLDQHFFQNPLHPARAFLNALSYIGIGITDQEDEMLPRLEIIIDTLINDYEQDSVSFQRSLDSLNKLIDKEIDKTNLNEQYTQKRVLRNHSRKIVLAELQQTIRGKHVPKSMEPLLLKLWPTQMYQQYLNYGKDSAQWKESVINLKQLINSVQPPRTQRALQHLMNHQDSIMQTIQDKLYATHQDKEQINRAIYDLSETYIDLINHSDIKDPEANGFDQFALHTLNDKTAELDDTSSNDKLFLDNESLYPEAVPDKREQLQLLPREVKPGLWFELYDGEDKPPRRLKLSVIIMEEAQLIFVNRQGVRIMEKNATEFANELERNLSSIIADHSVFDQALSTVITALQKTS